MDPVLRNQKTRHDLPDLNAGAFPKKEGQHSTPNEEQRPELLQTSRYASLHFTVNGSKYQIEPCASGLVNCARSGFERAISASDHLEISTVLRSEMLNHPNSEATRFIKENPALLAIANTSQRSVLS